MVPGHLYRYRVFPVFIESGPDAYGIPALIDASSQGAGLPTAARSVTAEADGQTACVVKWAPPADPGGHPVRGYLIQIADDDDGDPGEWTTINIDGGTAPFTVVGGATTEFKYTGNTAQLGDGNEATLTAGSVRWFRVIPVTNENDGDQTTGGTALNEDGTARTDTARNPTDEASPGDLPQANDAQRARRVKCTTEGLGDVPEGKVTADPQMPVDLTVEAASDTNSLADSDRGVFLTWNQQPVGEASATTSYRINRIRMNTGITALNSVDADEDGELDWQYVTRVHHVTSYTDSTDLRRPEETRVYQVCSEALGVADPVCVAMPASYALHADMHKPSAPQMVTATADSATEATVNWMTPADNGGSDITGFTVRWKMSSATDYDAVNEVTAMADASMHQVTGLTANTSYDFQVIATNVHGDSYPSMADTEMTLMIPGVPVLSAMKDANMPASQINLTWTGPDSADRDVTGYIIERAYGSVMFLNAADGVAHPDFVFSDHMEWWETLNCAGMLKAVGSDETPVDAPADDSDQAMYCAHYDMMAPSNTPGTIMAGGDVDMKIEEYFNKRYEIITDGTATSYMDTGLMENTEYSYRIRAFNGMDAGMWSNTATATTDSVDTSLMAPTNVTVTASGTGAISFTWEGGENADYFLLIAVDMSTIDSGNIMYDRALVEDATLRSDDVTGVNAGTEYLGIVVAVKGSGDAAEYKYDYARDTVTAQ